MTWVAAIIGVGGVVVGWGLTLLTQLLMFQQTSRKERLYKVRDALADFGAAAFSYLDARHDLASLEQREMNIPAYEESRAPRSERDQAEFDQHEIIMGERRRKAVAAHRECRDRLLASKARLYVITADKGIQARVRDMLQRLESMSPSLAVPPPVPNSRTNPEFAVVEVLRVEVDHWLSETADVLQSLFK